MEIYSLTYLAGVREGGQFGYYVVNGDSRFFIDVQESRLFPVRYCDFCYYDAVVAGSSSDASAVVVGQESPLAGIVSALVNNFSIGEHAAGIADAAGASLRDGFLQLENLSQLSVNGRHNGNHAPSLEALVEVTAKPFCYPETG